MSTYKDIIIDCLNNDKVIPPRIRLNIYNKILERIIIGDENNEYIIKNYKICFPEFDRNLILKNTNLFYLIKYSDISWFYTMQDRITFVKLIIDIVNKEIINN